MNKEQLMIPAAILVAAMMVCVCVAVTGGHSDSDDTPAWAKEAADKMNRAGGTMYYVDAGVSKSYNMPSNSTAVASPQGICIIENGYYYHFFPYEKITIVAV